MLLEGLWQAKDLDFSSLTVERDSIIVISWVCNRGEICGSLMDHLTKV